ncbi:MAG: S-formylglutathione hydrolase [Roseitalea sp.]|nr:S-formylglutathione hydrolase [Roseitalea sp.]MBO6953673.1 S-formylglutathione hydrolase [Rhizobiaceae bacterium]MBO6593898.1 S-formylglutathione hydrolase [Roseitalea sp.]MBO6601417.1 S-formylglutathione hydrolase [Roseitalea sp.]MBO6612913.1 S-formylglutathione hydrolase [Roseitalea sp.]
MQEALRHKSFGGWLTVHDHDSAVTNCTMRFAVYTPPQAADGPVPVLWYLSGLTCTWQNVNEKSGIHRHAAEHGMMVAFPDTSPRGEGVADDEAYDLGQGAGFYLTATEDPWARHFRMDRYIAEELPALVADRFPAADMNRQGIFGHSMGGHGALTLHLKHPERYRSVSAFAPIVAPSKVPWGQKAFAAYLGADRSAWQAYDATELVARQRSKAHILIDQGAADQFLAEQLRPELFAEACRHAGQQLTLNMRDGYDHSYYFVGTFMADHFAHHASVLKR